MDKFLTQNVWKEANDLIVNNFKQKFAAISYVTKNILNLNRGDILICDASEESVISGQTSFKSLEYYFTEGIEIYSVEGLHCKFVISDDYIIIGSANLSENSAENLIESAIYSENKDLIKETTIFFNNLLKIAEKLSKSKIKDLATNHLSKENISGNLKKSKRNDLFAPKEDNINNLYLTEIQEVKIRTNNESKYLYLKLIACDITAEDSETKHICNLTDNEIKEWEDAIQTDNFPKIYGRYIWVDNLPKYCSKKGKTEPQTKMRVFVFCDQDGNESEDPREIALAKLKNSGFYTICK